MGDFDRSVDNIAHARQIMEIRKLKSRFFSGFEPSPVLLVIFKQVEVIHMNESMIGNTIVNRFFAGKTVSDLWEACPNKMLWEALKKRDVEFITLDDIKTLSISAQYVYVLPELLPSLYLGITPAYRMVKWTHLFPNEGRRDGHTSSREYDILEIEPLYIVSYDFSWMIVLTTENTSQGSQLCVVTGCGIVVSDGSVS